MEISEFIAPKAAKQGGVYRLNIRYARAATFVIATICAISLALPSIIAFSSKSIKLFKPTKQTARVPTTFSLAIKPVTTAAASYEATPTIGISK